MLNLSTAERLALLKLAQATAPAPAAAAPSPIQPADRGGPLPLSFAQQRLWFLDQLRRAGTAYTISRRQRLKGPLHREALARALDRVVERHEALRTTFHAVDGVPVQRIAPVEQSRFHLREHDLRGDAAGEAELDRLMAEEAHAPFDLERGPLIRGRLVRLADDDHVLLLTMHHIVSDGWSMGVLTREVAALYAAHREGGDARLAALPVQYADYAAWQRRRVEGDLLRQQAEYWTRTLGGAPELLALPTDHPRPAEKDYAGGLLALELDPELTAALKALGRRHGTTLFMTLLAGWAAVLGRLSGQDDVVVGTAAANRGRQEIEGLIGFFVNTLAVRVDLSGAPTVAELLGRVKERTLGAQHHQDIPFEQVVERVAPGRTLSHTPLFQVMFAWQEMAREGGLALPALEVGRVPAASLDAQAQFDLSLTLREAGDRIVGSITYAASLFERETVERWAGYLRRVLREMAADEHRRVERLALLPAEERSRVVEGWNRTRAHPSASCIHTRFERQVERAPQAPAVSFEGRHLTYAELNARANRLAHHLRSLGVGPDVRVALCVERGLEMMVAILAVLKAGGAYVPLDPGYPADRLAFMLADSAPAAVLTQASLRDRVGGAKVPVLALDADAPAWADAPAADPAAAGLTPDHLAYIIYTSGSTGRPKGVLVPHRNVARLFSATDAWFGFGTDDVWTLFHSVAFDFSVWEMWGALLYGGRLVVVPGETTRSPDAFYRLLCDEGVTVLNQTPSAFYQLMKAQASSDGAHRLRHVVFGGEALDVPLLRPWFQRNGDAAPRLVNMYGITETTVHVTWRPLSWADVERAGASPIGERIPDLRAYLLDAAGEPVPVGVPGELYVGGAGLARGYLGRPELTAQRFVADPFGGEPGARLYRTGDLGRWRPDGALEYLGRTDHQVKVRGFRIELGEVEARLLEHPGVREGVVLALDDGSGGKRLVAYVVGGETAAADGLRAHLGERLPAYMVPAAFVRLEEWPLTANGKLDRRALPAPENDAYAARAYEAPVGPVEQALAQIWSEVLRIGRVGRHDDFFALGGHSLLAVQVISRVRQVLAVEAELGQVFTRSVLQDFARGLQSAARAGLPPIEPAPRGDRLPLSFAQQRLWFLEQMGGMGGTYHIPMRRRLRGPLDRGALVRALDTIVARHEALRTVIARVDGEPEQRVTPADAGFHLVEHDLGGAADAPAELGRWMADEADAPFDLERGPLIRGRLIRLADDDHVLLLTMHHIVSDGWSMGVMTRELGALYAAFSRAEPDPLPPLPVQSADYAAWQRRWLTGDVLREQADYWTRTLSGAPELLALPTDRPRPAEQDFRGAALELELDEPLTAALAALSRRHGTTLFMTLLAGWAAVLSRLSGQEDVVIGTPSANRGRAEIEGLIGFFVNTLALRVDLSGAPDVAGLLERVKEAALGAQQHQDIPFEQVVELMQPARSMGHTPLFQAMFTWQNAAQGGMEMPGLELGEVGGARKEVSAKFDLSLTMWQAGGRIRGTVEYATALFDPETVERHAGYLRAVLGAMAAAEAQRVDRIELLSGAERHRVLQEWNATDAEYPAGSCVHERFQAQVERTPGAVAVVSGEERLTYAQLNARANRLAHHLRGLGVGPDARVALCVERGPAMVVGLLAILKAGGAYVPLDPGSPRERLEHMLRDSAPLTVLTQARIRDRVDGAGVPVLSLDEDAGRWAAESEGNPERGELGPEHLAYIIYTSGSTGVPKGVMVEHRNVCHQVAAVQSAYGLTERDRCLQFASVTFDASVEEIFGALLTGAALVLRDDAWLAAPADFWSRCREHGVTVVDLPTRFWQLLADEPAAAVPACVRLVVIGGEAVDAASLAAWFRRDGHRPRLLNTYGPTETTVNATVREMADDPARWRSIGRPVANARVYVLDGERRPVPVGVAGELYVGGAGVARGYLHRPELTAERFVEDPFCGRPGARMYRTGDLVRWLPDGSLEFLGRNDFQVKIRGFRVELGEIEARLAEHPGVRQAVVLARQDVPGQQRLVAYYAGDETPDVDALRAHLLERLPDYMVPAAYVRLERLPVTSSGKLDRQALPVPADEAYARRGYEAPVGETEQALAEIWSEVLRVEQVGRHDNFFELGGHSLLAVQVISRVRQVLDVDLALRSVFESPTLSQLSHQVLLAQLAEFDPTQIAELTELAFASAGD
jgi:amino acid adenylation domain-containing protein